MQAVRAKQPQTPDTKSRCRELWFLGLRVLAVGLFFIYVCWNIFWLLRGRMAPSMMLGFFGLPGPTTGLTRALRAALEGRWALSMAYHPLALPIAVVFAVSIVLPLWQITHRRKARLPHWVAWTWFVLLLAGWIFKILENPVWW